MLIKGPAPGAQVSWTRSAQGSGGAGTGSTSASALSSRAAAAGARGLMCCKAFCRLALVRLGTDGCALLMHRPFTHVQGAGLVRAQSALRALASQELGHPPPHWAVAVPGVKVWVRPDWLSPSSKGWWSAISLS